MTVKLALPEPGTLVEATCGCTGHVGYASALYGGYARVLVAHACRGGHPYQVLPGVTERFTLAVLQVVVVVPEPVATPEPVEPVGQLTLDFTQMEIAA